LALHCAVQTAEQQTNAVPPITDQQAPVVRGCTGNTMLEVARELCWAQSTRSTTVQSTSTPDAGVQHHSGVMLATAFTHYHTSSNRACQPSPAVTSLKLDCVAYSAPVHSI
jgi:hypothetical protein